MAIKTKDKRSRPAQWALYSLWTSREIWLMCAPWNRAEAERKSHRQHVWNVSIRSPHAVPLLAAAYHTRLLSCPCYPTPFQWFLQWNLREMAHKDDSLGWEKKILGDYIYISLLNLHVIYLKIKIVYYINMCIESKNTQRIHTQIFLAKEIKSGKKN